MVLHALPADNGAVDEAGHDSLLLPLLKSLPLKQAVALAAEIGGAPRNALYARALELKGGTSPEGDTD